MKNEKIFCAIDTKNLNEAYKICKKIKGYVAGIKLGLEFFAANGPKGVKKISSLNIPIFLDLKFFDIETTVIKAIKSLNGLKIKYVSIHVLNGEKTLRKAKKEANKLAKPIKLLGVTILTSFSKKMLNQIGIKGTVKKQVILLAKLAKKVGLDGIVCSPQEIKVIKKICKKMKIITPGIRPTTSRINDQKRISTPRKAIEDGSDYLVIGRPITKGDPVKNIKKIINSFN